MGKPITAHNKPIHLEGAQLVAAASVPVKAGEPVEEPMKRRVRFRETPSYSEAPSIPSPPVLNSAIWFSRLELEDMVLQNKHDMATRKMSDCHDCEEFSWRGLESYRNANTSRFRREHVANVVRLARMCRAAPMLAQFAMQSSGSSGSTRAAHLRAVSDEYDAKKIYEEKEDDDTASMTSSETSTSISTMGTVEY